ncbi:MAG: Fpg/Nei family DNA glycosylase [Chloroflexi bacterium]|nr:MAG: Fpg/Nei family DNA glycosylase [Chloroflexota bacterium]
MPEGDTLWRTANALRPRLAGKAVLEARPERFRRLEGMTVTAVDTNGKHLLIHVEGGLVIHSHLRMTGSWHLYRPGERWRKPARLAKLVLANRDTVAVLFNAPLVELLREKEVPRELGHLGPDILAPTLDLEEILRRARAAGDRPLGELLLDQRVSAGIGNIYKCESLWRLQLDPWRPVGEVGDETLRKLYGEARTLMLAALRGRVPHAVHGRAGRLCPRCSTRIQIRGQGAQTRFTYWCPTCQRPGLR